ncbi:hypothetical protein BGZ57DRAFT_291339 [Hyaloscypha finlandica]|nr:hypothetical protein BGZ57DRAFT_291339 [Hyaloscypha finlandica]
MKKYCLAKSNKPTLPITIVMTTALRSSTSVWITPTLVRTEMIVTEVKRIVKAKAKPTTRMIIPSAKERAEAGVQRRVSTSKVVFRKITQNPQQGEKLGTTLLLITWNLKQKSHPRSHSSRLRQASSRGIKRPRVLALKITVDVALSGLGQLEVTSLILYMTYPRSPKALHTHSLLPDHRKMPSPSRGKSTRETIRPIMKNWTLDIECTDQMNLSLGRLVS